MPATPAELLEAIEYPAEASADPDNVLTAAVTAAFQAADDMDPETAPWQVVNNIADLLPGNPDLSDEALNYQRGLAAGLALALLTSA